MLFDSEQSPAGFTDQHSEYGVNVTVEELVQLKIGGAGLNLAAHRNALAAMAGGHHSAFRGRGVDFDETRIYQPGDDVRNIDWRVTARTGKAHTKIFREERERPIYIVVDQGATMYFGSQVCFKSVAAARVAAILAWGAMENKDRIGGLVFSDWDHQELRPREGKKGIQAFFRTLVNYNQAIGPHIRHSDKPNTRPLTNAIATLNRIVKPGSLVFVISDFHDFDDFTWQNLSLLSRHNDIIGTLIYDKMELELPPPGTYGFSDGEKRLRVDTSAKALRNKYTQRFTQHHKRVRGRLMELGIALIDIATHANLNDTLRVALGKRTQVRRR